MSLRKSPTHSARARRSTAKIATTAAIMLIALGVACSADVKTQEKPAVAKAQAAAEPPAVDDGLEPGSAEAARALVAKLADTSTRSATVLALEPAHADYLAVYGEAFGSAVETHYKDAWKRHEIVPSPWGPDQTEVQLSRGSTADFQAWQGEARKFPRGYKRIAEFMQPDRIFYQFRFLKPGEGAGANWDGLVWVGGAWKLFPKPYDAAPEGSSFYRDM